MAETAVLQSPMNLKDLVFEASQALARLDSNRLEELALSCQALNLSLQSVSLEDRTLIAAQAVEAQAGMTIFSRVLGVTERNLTVMNRMRASRTQQFEYSEAQARGRTNALSSSVGPSSIGPTASDWAGKQSSPALSSTEASYGND